MNWAEIKGWPFLALVIHISFHSFSEIKFSLISTKLPTLVSTTHLNSYPLYQVFNS
jgi:hypothetical protein